MNLGPDLRSLDLSMIEALLSFVLSTCGMKVLIEDKHINGGVEFETKVDKSAFNQTRELYLMRRVQTLIHQDENASRFVIRRTWEVICVPALHLVAGVMAPMGLLYSNDMEVPARTLKPQ